MQTAAKADRLVRFAGRGAGTDAERRAAAWLAGELSETGREVSIETFWCRPNWALAQAWHCALALAGSLTSVASPRAGGAMLLAALVFTLMDALAGVSPGRRLTPERASQNVVARARQISDDTPARLKIILTANYDAGRAGLVYRDSLRRPWARLRRVLHGATPGWQGWLVIAIAWAMVAAILRIEGASGVGIGVLQLPPTIALVLALAALLELATAGYSPGAGDNGTGVGVVLALIRPLDAARYASIDVDVVLAGAGNAAGIGLKSYLRAHRAELHRADTALIGVAPCSGGSVRWWRSDGPLLPLRYGRRLIALAEDVADDVTHIGALPHGGRGATPAFPGRLARIPSIAIGCLDADGLAPGSHHPRDTTDAVDPSAADDALQFCLILFDAIDADLVTRA